MPDFCDIALCSRLLDLIVAVEREVHVTIDAAGVDEVIDDSRDKGPIAGRPRTWKESVEIVEVESV